MFQVIDLLNLDEYSCITHSYGQKRDEMYNPSSFTCQIPVQHLKRFNTTPFYKWNKDSRSDNITRITRTGNTDDDGYN